MGLSEAILTPKLVGKSQRWQRANYLFIKPSPALCPRSVPSCYLKRSTFDTDPRCNFQLTESKPSLFSPGAYSVGKNGVAGSTMGSIQISISVGGLSRARFHRRLETPPTSCFQGRVGHVFCEIAIFQQNLCRRQKDLQRSFFPNVSWRGISIFVEAYSLPQVC